MSLKIPLMIVAGIVTSVFLLAVSVLAADTPKPADVLGRWPGGKWVAEGKGVDSEFSKANTVSGVSNCAWSPDHVFVVCDQAFTVNGKSDRALAIFAFDPEKSAYHMFGMSQAGERPRLVDLTISPDGKRWEYPNTNEINGKPVQFRTVNVFRDNDHVDFWAEYSTDNGAHWTKTLEGKESRQK